MRHALFCFALVCVLFFASGCGESVREVGSGDEVSGGFGGGSFGGGGAGGSW